MLKVTHGRVHRVGGANASVVDTTIWKFNEPLIKASTEALSTLGFFKGTPAIPRP
jgi:hypothetical protein